MSSVINEYSDYKFNITEHNYLFGYKDPAATLICILMKYITWSTRNYGSSFSVYSFKYSLFKRIKVDEYFKSRVKFETKWKSYLKLYEVLKDAFEYKCVL